MNLAKYSLDNTKIIYFFLAVLLIGGIFSFGRLGKKEDAPFVIKTAVIMTRYPGAERKQSFRAVLCTSIYISTFVPNLNFGQDEHKRRRQVLCLNGS